MTLWKKTTMIEIDDINNLRSHKDRIMQRFARFAFTLGILGGLALLAACGGDGSSGAGGAPGAAKPLKIKFSTELEETHPTVQAMKVFKQRIEELSHGALTVDLFANGLLGNSNELVEGVQVGNVEMATVSAAPIAQYVTLANAFTMPFIFRDYDHLAAAMAGQPGDALRDQASKAGIEIAGFFDAGSRNITCKKHGIYKPEDLQGMKIRVMASNTMVDTINDLGGSAVPMNYGEVYTALQQGVLDGWENNPPTIMASRTFETGCIYFSWTRHMMIPDLIIVSPAFLGRLSAEQRGWFDQAVADTMARQLELWNASVQQALDGMKENGMIINDVDRAPFIEKTRPIYERYYEKYGEDFRRICQQIQAL